MSGPTVGKNMKVPAHSLSNSERISRGLRVMFRTMRPRHDDLILPEIHYTSQGDEYHVYYPAGKPLRTVVLIYGMTIEGAQDGRVLKFARACANAGLKVIVPHLPGLMDFTVTPGDMQRLEHILGSLNLESETKMALIGFSTGGGYALLLAANPQLADKIGPLILFSPIYDARDVFERIHAPADPPPHTPKEWDQYYWGQYVVAFRNRAQLGLSHSALSSLHIFLADYDRHTLETKRAFYEAYIAPHNLLELSGLLNEGPALDQLSARGHLAEVTSPVFILHDASDRVVPPDHSRHMHAELALRGAASGQDMLITPWLSHVVMQKTGSPAELLKIVSFVSELFREVQHG